MWNIFFNYVFFFSKKFVIIKKNYFKLKKNPCKFRRGCLFSRERHLKFFQIYTKCNCEIECISNYTHSKCGCVQFHMPRDRSTRICGANDMTCYNKAHYDLLQRNLEEEIHGKVKQKCNCLPACNSLEYDAYVSDVLFNWKDHMKASKESVAHLNKWVWTRFYGMHFL